MDLSISITNENNYLKVGLATFNHKMTKKRLNQIITNYKQEFLSSLNWHFELNMKELDWNDVFKSMHTADCQSFRFSMSIVGFVVIPSILYPQYNSLLKLQIKGNFLLSAQLLPFLNAQSLKELNFSGNFIISGKPFSKLCLPNLEKFSIIQNFILQMNFSRMRFGANFKSMEIQVIENFMILNQDVSFFAKFINGKQQQNSKICFLDDKRIKQSNTVKVLKKKNRLAHLKDLNKQGIQAFDILVRLFGQIQNAEQAMDQEQPNQ